MSGLAEKAVIVEAALSIKRSALATERERAKEAVQNLKIARVIATDKEKELERAIRVKLKAEETAAGAQVMLETVRRDLAIVRAKGPDRCY